MAYYSDTDSPPSTPSRSNRSDNGLQSSDPRHRGRRGGKRRQDQDREGDKNGIHAWIYGVLGSVAVALIIWFMLHLSENIHSPGFLSDPLNHIEREREQLEMDRQRHADESQVWLAQYAHVLGQLWSAPQPEDRCKAYNTREYTAEFDLAAICETAPMFMAMIHNKSVTTAVCTQYSEGRSNKITGHFTIARDEPDCRPYWGKWNDKGCIQRGRRGVHRWESRLWGLRRGDDWQRMCNTSPATIDGIQFSRPTRCEGRGLFRGMVGIFEYQDSTCVWNDAAETDEEDENEDE